MLCDGGVLLLGKVNRLREEVRCALQSGRGEVYSWVLDASSGPSVANAYAEWSDLVGWETLPAGVVIPVRELAGMKELSARLALSGGVLGVFTELQPALTWARRQAIVFVAEVGWRNQAAAGTSRKPWLEP